VPPTGKTCAPGAASKDPGVTATTITIGNVSTVSGGPVPGLFAGAREGTEAAVNYINANGGVCGPRLNRPNNFDPTAAPPTSGFLQGPHKINAVKSDGIKGIIFQATAQIIGEMASQMYSAGLIVPFANWSLTAYDRGFLQAPGPGANGAILTTDFVMHLDQDNTAGAQALDEYYKATHNWRPGPVRVLRVAVGVAVGAGFNAGGAPTRAATMAGLKAITNFNAGGLVAPDNPVGKQPPTCWIAIDVKGSQFVRVPRHRAAMCATPAATDDRSGRVVGGRARAAPLGSVACGYARTLAWLSSPRGR